MVKTLLQMHHHLPLLHQSHHPLQPYSLPQNSEPSQKSTPSKDLPLAQSSTPSTLKLNVLIVDDNLLNLRVMKQLLKKKLSRFLHLDSLQTASSGLEALDLLSSHQFHLVFLDISMPGISGLEVCRRLRQSDPSSPHLHICAVTTDLAEWQIQHYRGFGMDGVIGKPLKDTDLQFALETCLESPTVNHTYGHMCSRSNPRFYFRRHGAHQPLPPPLSIQPDSADLMDQSNSWDSLSSVTCTTPPSCPICQAESRSSLTFSDDLNDRKYRQQSIVSDAHVSSLLTYGDSSEPPLHMARSRLEQFVLTSESLDRERSPSFESFDTSTPGSTTTYSSGPSSVVATDLLSPSYPPSSIDMPRLTSCHRLAAFPTAPIMTMADVRSLPRVEHQRRWDSFSCSFAANPRAYRFGKQEKDVFADGFGAAMQEAPVGHVSSAEDWRETCRSPRRSSHGDFPSNRDIDYEAYFSSDESSSIACSPQELHSLRMQVRRDSTRNRSGSNKDERWTRLAVPVSNLHLEELSRMSAVTRQLITRRSHPVLRRNRQEEEVKSRTLPSPIGDQFEAPMMRKALSASGLPGRPSWQLVQLSALNYQSVLKSGGLLDEVLIGLDLEDYHHQQQD